MPLSLEHFWSRLTQRKPVSRSLSQVDETATKLSWYHLLAYGFSATVGGGIYVVVGEVAHHKTGPAVIFSILGSGILSLLTAFVYLELATMVPASGSGYIYGYTYLGEFFGFLLAWISTLEYAFAGSVTAVSFVQFFVEVINSAASKTVVPEYLYSAIPSDSPMGYFFEGNLLAFLLIGLVTLIVLRGLNFSTKFNMILTCFNLAVLLFVVGFGAFHIDSTNYQPFFPFPVSNVFHGTATIIYSYIGFDTICNLTGEARSPIHLHIGVVGTVMTATLLYIAAGFVLTGIVNYTDIVPATSLASSFSTIGYEWVAYIVRVCALFMMTATLLACLIGQPKLFEAMAKDGIMPPVFLKKSKSNITVWNILICSALSAVIALFVRVFELVDMISMGALTAFTLNAIGLIISRLERYPKVYKPGLFLTLGIVAFSLTSSWLLYFECYIASFVFMGILFACICMLFGIFIRFNSFLAVPSTLCPLMPLIPVLSILGNSIVLPTIPAKTFAQFAIWLVLGVILYFAYGYSHSKLRDGYQSDGASEKSNKF